ncbi:MAG: hypothetical protein JWO06_858 [Bacteroidota bacterium]|nr:hypothetical protein [Bacteroidota bacterium]
MIINASIQVIPLIATAGAFPMVDRAIELIQKSGLKYTVGAFETLIEGEYEKVQALLRAVEDFCYGQKEVQFLVYSKLHLCGGMDIYEESKTAKFR